MSAICGSCRRPIARCVADPCAQRAEDNRVEAITNQYDAGRALFRAGAVRPLEGHERDGWDDARHDSMVRVVMVPRPEGYYHQNPNGEA